mgnify:CR=1 FL=1
MSSDYYVICVSHHPALVAHEQEYRSPHDALAAAAEPAGHERLARHVNCDLVVGRESGAFVEFACPGGIGPDKRPGAACAGYHGHAVDTWTDRGWLRLLHAAHLAEVPTAGLQIRPCWTYERVMRLAPLLGIPAQPIPTGGTV